MDPPRLRSEPGLEGRLLRSAPSIEPAPSAQDELWRRLQIATAVGLAAGAVGAATATSGACGATATAAAAPTAAAGAAEIGVNVATKAAWLALVKWGAILAVGIPAAGVGTYAAIQHHRAVETKARATMHAPPPPPPAAPAPPPVVIPSEPETAPAPVVGSSPVTAPRPAHGRQRDALGAETRSALLAESALLADARAKLAAENYRGALDDVARLENRFPHGRLVQEREVVAIDAHAALGNRAALRARAQAFLERFPQSPYASHVRQSLEQ